jgi:Ca2+-binding RTX toxin-like protein
LTFNFAATAGDDLINIIPGAADFTIDIQVGNTLVATTGDNDVRISGLGGDDQFVMTQMPHHSSSIFDIKFIGGPGNDRYDLGEGKFTPVFSFGIIRIEENAGEGNDRLFINNANEQEPAHPSIKSDRIGDIAFFDDQLELKQVSYSDGDDNVVVDSIPAGLRLEMNSGNDTVTFGGAGKRINGKLAAGDVVGGFGTDKVIFDDSGGDANVNRDYPISATGILHQTMEGVEQAELKVRRNITDLNGAAGNEGADSGVSWSAPPFRPDAT